MSVSELSEKSEQNAIRNLHALIESFFQKEKITSSENAESIVTCSSDLCHYLKDLKNLTPKCLEQ